jgi:hypothetical protein
MLDGDGMDSLLKCIVPGVCGFLLLCPIVANAQDQCYLTPALGDAYPHRGAPGHAEAFVPFPGSWVSVTEPPREGVCRQDQLE